MGFDVRLGSEDLRDAACASQFLSLSFIVNQQEVGGSHPQTDFDRASAMVNRHEHVLQFTEGQSGRGVGEVFAR